MKERNIATKLKEVGFKETLTDEDYTVVSYIWFYSEVKEDNKDAGCFTTRIYRIR